MGFFGGKKQGGSSSEKLRPSNVGAREFPQDNVMSCTILLRALLRARGTFVLFFLPY